METTKQSIGEIVRKMENDYVNGSTQLSKYVSFSMSENIEKIEAYLNSKHTTGDRDSKGREKPFFNIVNAAVNIWYRATDIDRKNIRIKSTKSANRLAAFLATIHLRDWMRKANFGVVLNDWGRSLAKYGSSVLKFIEKDGELKAIVVPWSQLIVDPIDFENNVKIEILELTEAQLRAKEGYDKQQVDELCDAFSPRKTIDGRQKDTKSEYIKLYEVHGELPLSYLTDDERDDDIFVQQMHVISFTGDGKQGKNSGYRDFTLVKGKEAKDPYMITHLLKEDGRTMSIGAVEHLFESQWMINHNMKAIKDQLDLASKLIFQTSDGSFVSQNVLNSIDTGDILIHKKDEPITKIANDSHDITSLLNYAQQWRVLAQEVTGTPDIMQGKTMPSGTAYRLGAILQQESHSNFEIMTENKGLAIEYMMREYVIPHIKKKMDNANEISATLEEHEITMIDSKYVKNKTNQIVNKSIKEKILKGETVSMEEQAMLTELTKEGVESSLAEMGTERFFKPSELSDKTWKEEFKDLEWEVEVEVTDETVDKDATLSTLTTVLQTIATNPQILENPNAKMLFSKILENTGVVSMMELKSAQSQPTPPPEETVSPVRSGGQVETGLTV
jgi:hypothetical protein